MNLVFFVFNGIISTEINLAKLEQEIRKSKGVNQPKLHGYSSSKPNTSFKRFK